MKRAMVLMATMLAGAATAQELPPADRQLAHDVFKQLIETNTTDSVGSVTKASEGMRQRLLDAGFAAADLQLLGPNNRKMNLVATYRGKPGNGLKPILVICHLDVVEAKREDWTSDPFQMVEKDGYFYGRGTIDMKDGDAAAVVSFIKMKREGYVPDRDIVLALTADEEGGQSNGVDWLLDHEPVLAHAAFVINPDAGGIETVNGKPLTLSVEAAEKTYADFEISATSPGGHSSETMPGNPIYRVTNALGKLEAYSFPFELNSVTRAELAAHAKVEPEPMAGLMLAVLKTPPDPKAVAALSANPVMNPTFRTTCVATMMSAGHAANALPAMAEANVNCRILPGHTQEQVRQDLIKVFADKDLRVQYKSDAGMLADTAPQRASAAPPPPLAKVFDPLRKTAEQFWPGIAIVPGMSAGASDSVFTMAKGIPSYGISGMAMDRDENRAHGRDERIKQSDFYTGVEFFYAYLKALTNQ